MSDTAQDCISDGIEDRIAKEPTKTHVGPGVFYCPTVFSTSWLEICRGMEAKDNARIKAQLLEDYTKDDKKIHAGIIGTYIGRQLEGENLLPQCVEPAIEYFLSEQADNIIDRQFFADFLLYDILRFPARLDGYRERAERLCSTGRTDSVRAILEAQSRRAVAEELIIPGRKSGEKYVQWVTGVLTESECRQWIEHAEKQGFQPASLLSDQATKNPHRNNDRVILFDAERARLLTERLKPFLPATWTYDGQTWSLVGLNDRLSCLRYRSDEHYGRHVDIPHEDEKTGARSFITCQLYLSQDFTGGQTRFMQEVGYAPGEIHNRQHLDVTPVTGSALLFEHELTHEGCAVLSGTKYTIRIDVMYQLEQTPR